MVDDSHRVSIVTAVSATATAAMINAMTTTVVGRAAVHDGVHHAAGQYWRRHREQRGHDAERDEAAQPAVVPRREPPDTAQQRAVRQRMQVTVAARAGLSVQRLPCHRLQAHVITVKPQQWMRSNHYPARPIAIWARKPALSAGFNTQIGR